jgi:hypothetical protein
MFTIASFENAAKYNGIYSQERPSRLNRYWWQREISFFFFVNCSLSKKRKEGKNKERNKERLTRGNFARSGNSPRADCLKRQAGRH